MDDITLNREKKYQFNISLGTIFLKKNTIKLYVFDLKYTKRSYRIRMSQILA